MGASSWKTEGKKKLGGKRGQRWYNMYEREKPGPRTQIGIRKRNKENARGNCHGVNQFGQKNGNTGR